MSEKNVEVVLEAFRRFESGDVQGMGELLDANVVATAAPGWPEPGPYHGREAFVTQFERIASDWSDHRIAKADVVADEGDWVVIDYRWQVRGGASGIETQMDLVGAFRLSGGLCVEAHYRWTRDEALEAAGLSE
jgi:ketosteroid isomerase-like protein